MSRVPLFLVQKPYQYVLNGCGRQNVSVGSSIVTDGLCFTVVCRKVFVVFHQMPFETTLTLTNTSEGIIINFAHIVSCYCRIVSLIRSVKHNNPNTVFCQFYFLITATTPLLLYLYAQSRRLVIVHTFMHTISLTDYDLPAHVYVSATKPHYLSYDPT